MNIQPAKGEEVSILALGTILLRSCWRIFRWMLAGAVISGVVVLLRPRTYLASASFYSQSEDQARSGLAGIAGQLGLSIPTANLSRSPEFYVKLASSRALLDPIVRDTFAVAELKGQRKPVVDLLGVPAGAPAWRVEQGVAKLQRLLAVSPDKATGIIEVSIGTAWRSVSLAFVTDLVRGINDYNERTRQTQASAERQFIEGRLAVASDDLRNAEDRLTDFMSNNRDASAPGVSIGLQRLQRAVGLRQEVFTSLNEAYEDARIREVRDTPVISVFEPPFAPTLPARRGLLVGVVLGTVVGGLIGAFLALAAQLVARKRDSGSPEAEEFATALGEAKGQFVGGVRRLTGGRRR